jgi:hypothetical protein
MTQSNSYELRKLGYSRDLSEGIVTALKNYEKIDVDKYITLIHESLQYLRPNDEKLPDLQIEKKAEKKEIIEEPIVTENSEKKEEVELVVEEEKDDSKDSEKIENIVLDIITEIEGEDGASWDSITKKCEKAGLNVDSIEESLNSLMDKGLIYEPVLGTIKTT